MVNSRSTHAAVWIVRPICSFICLLYFKIKDVSTWSLEWYFKPCMLNRIECYFGYMVETILLTCSLVVRWYGLGREHHIGTAWSETCHGHCGGAVYSPPVLATPPVCLCALPATQLLSPGLHQLINSPSNPPGFPAVIARSYFDTPCLWTYTASLMCPTLQPASLLVTPNKPVHLHYNSCTGSVFCSWV